MSNNLRPRRHGRQIAQMGTDAHMKVCELTYLEVIDFTVLATSLLRHAQDKSANS